MGWTYFKRYRMELELGRGLFSPPAVSSDYALVGWDEGLVATHAEVKFQSFCYEMDANVFPCLGEREGCRRLMREIAGRDGFIPEATWLVAFLPEGSRGPVEYCGTVQGVRDAAGYGAIQNLGVLPTHRGRGLGSLLMHAALSGFREAGLQRVYLEVTAQNVGAVALYERLGFRRTKTVYKAADVAWA